MNARRPYTWNDHDADPEQGGEFRPSAGSSSVSSDPRLGKVERRRELAEQVAAHMNANQNPSYKVTGRVWSKGGHVRVYSNVDSYIEILVDPSDDGIYYTHSGRDRGSCASFEAAWQAAD